MNRAAVLLLAFLLAIVLAGQGVAPLTAQSDSPSSVDAAAARSALEVARAQQRSAQKRAEALEAEVTRATQAEARARAEVAALAARIQQEEAGLAAAEAEFALVERRRQTVARNLARSRQPLADLAASLERMTRRPLVLAALQPGSLQQLVHTRAALASTLPVVRSRTATMRTELDLARRIEAERARSLAATREAGQRLDEKRKDLIALAQSERIRAAQATGGIGREAARAIELAEQTRSLEGLVEGLEGDAALRTRLAALDGPLVRPARPGDVAAPAAAQSRPAAQPGGLGRYLLPVTGRIGRGFGEADISGARRPGIVLVPRPSAQVVAPGAGRVAFAGPYEGYGRIVIIEHEGGWTSLVTGLSDLSVEPGSEVDPGSPLGKAAQRNPQIGLELRRAGQPVNPLDRMR